MLLNIFSNMSFAGLHDYLMVVIDLTKHLQLNNFFNFLIIATIF